jgi:hypothetical protein
MVRVQTDRKPDPIIIVLKSDHDRMILKDWEVYTYYDGRIKVCKREVLSDRLQRRAKRRQPRF